MAIHSDMEILLSDMLSGDESPYGQLIEKREDNSYYHGFGIHLSRQVDNKEHYFNLLMGVVDKFKELDDKQKEMLQNKMEIFPKTVYKDKIVYKEKPTKTKKSKPKLNTRDDY